MARLGIDARLLGRGQRVDRVQVAFVDEAPACLGVQFGNTPADQHWLAHGRGIGEALADQQPMEDGHLARADRQAVQAAVAR